MIAVMGFVMRFLVIMLIMLWESFFSIILEKISCYCDNFTVVHFQERGISS